MYVYIIHEPLRACIAINLPPHKEGDARSKDGTRPAPSNEYVVAFEMSLFDDSKKSNNEFLVDGSESLFSCSWVPAISRQLRCSAAHTLPCTLFSLYTMIVEDGIELRITLFSSYTLMSKVDYDCRGWNWVADEIESRMELSRELRGKLAGLKVRWSQKAFRSTSPGPHSHSIPTR